MTRNQDIAPVFWKQKPGPVGLFITDFDGTLLRSDRTFSDDDLEALHRLGRLNICRVIATGRSIFSFNTVVGPDLPLDFVIFSTGAGMQGSKPENVKAMIEFSKAYGIYQ